MLHDWTAMLNDKRSELLGRRPVQRESLQAHQYADVLDDAMATEAYDQIVSLTNADTLLLYAVDEALARLATGEYAICIDCAGNIPDVRLRAAPWASRCVQCQGHYDDDNRGNNLPRKTRATGIYS